MTAQQHADAALTRWQELRALEPADRMSILLLDFFREIPPSEAEYDATLRLVGMEMADA